MTDTAGLRIREGARAVLIDPDWRVLLVRWTFPDVDVWGTPGGGVEPDEDVIVALRRELDEELGIGERADIGPEIWERTHIIPFISGLWDGQHDRFFYVPTPAFEPAPHLTPAQLAAEHVAEFAWWDRDRLASFVPTEREFFAPRRLPALVADLVRDGPPSTLIDTGV